jgi:fatty acid desaturase
VSLEALADFDESKSKNAWREAFSVEELEALRRVDDWRGWFTVALNWAMVAGLFALVAIWPNPLTIVVALIGLGGRQLGCAVLMHEAGHRTLFSNRRLNEWAGNWLGAYPSWSGEVEPYRRYHGVHHAHTGTPRDPDWKLAAAFPVTRRSLLRKIWRDLSGQTGYKQARLLIQRDLGIGAKQNQRNRGLKVGQRPDVGWHKLVPVLVTNGVIFGACWIAGHPAVYLLWPIAWLTTYRLALRIRSIAEHGMSEAGEDPFRNTRTVLASVWARFFFAPNRVNYHLEHHLVMTIPHYNLPRFHRMLRERGLLDGALLDERYVDVLRQVSTAPA